MFGIWCRCSRPHCCTCKCPTVMYTMDSVYCVVCSVMFENFQYGKFGEVKCWKDKKYLRKFKTKTTFDFSSMSYLQLHPSTQPIFYRVEIFELFMGVEDLSLPPSPRAAPAGEELIGLKSSKISTQYLIASSYSLGIASCTVVGELHTSYNGSSVQRDVNNNINRKCRIIKATWSLVTSSHSVHAWN